MSKPNKKKLLAASISGVALLGSTAAQATCDDQETLSRFTKLKTTFYVGHGQAAYGFESLALGPMFAKAAAAYLEKCPDLDMNANELRDHILTLVDQYQGSEISWKKGQYCSEKEIMEKFVEPSPERSGGFMWMSTVCSGNTCGSKEEYEQFLNLCPFLSQAGMSAQDVMQILSTVRSVKGYESMGYTSQTSTSGYNWTREAASDFNTNASKTIRDYLAKFK